MILKNVFAAVALGILSFNAQASTLVYATDANGSVVSGSLQTLRTALNSGANVKVLVTAPNDHVWAVPCTNTSVKLDASQAVVCVSNQGLGMNISMGSQFGGVSNPPQSVHFLLNTSGQYVQANIDMGSGTLVSRSAYVFAMQWYVD
ncbi:hypothetical protein [Xanthomonas sacchari]|uniref:hypothetical protein n=1 Tax=Xanthomonas sacchari TaxID=56458 RepID=UPI00224ECBD2|nr:hypothetical protein [Xanthomonas sacchari]